MNLQEHAPITGSSKPINPPSVVISFRIPIEYWWRLTEVMERSTVGYDSVSDFMLHLLRTQAFRKR